MVPSNESLPLPTIKNWVKGGRGVNEFIFRLSGNEFVFRLSENEFVFRLSENEFIFRLSGYSAP